MTAAGTAVGATALACVATPVTIRQSSFVPAPAVSPPVDSERRADMYTSIVAVSAVAQPSLAPATNAGLWVPQEQVEGALSARPARRLTVRVPYLYAPSSSAIPTSPGLLPNSSSDVVGAGLGVSGRIGGFELPVSIDLSADILGVSVPSYVIVTDDMTGTSRIETGTKAVGLLSTAATFNVRATDWLTLSATAGMRNHPTNEAYSTGTDPFPPTGATFGPLVFTAATSLEFRLWSWFSVVAQAQWTVSDFPVRYGPMFVLGARTRFGDVPRAMGHRPAPPRRLPMPLDEARALESHPNVLAPTPISP